MCNPKQTCYNYKKQNNIFQFCSIAPQINFINTEMLLRKVLSIWIVMTLDFKTILIFYLILN